MRPRSQAHRPIDAGRWARRRGALLWILASAAIYVALALLYTYPLVRHLGNGVLRGLDTEDALEQTWVLAWVQHAVLTHNIHLFNAPIFYPTSDTFAYQDTIAPVALAMLPLSGLVHNPLIVYNVSVLLSYPLCGLCMYWLAFYLCRDHRAAFLAGLIFAFCPYRERHIEHLNQLSAEGIPLIILAFEAARREGGPWRWAALGAASMLCATLSLYYLAFALLGLAIYATILLFKRLQVIAPGAWRGTWALAALLPLQGALLAPYLHTEQTVGNERKLQDIVYFSADLRDFLHAGPQSLLYGWTDALWKINPLDVHQYLFTGWTALALALLALRRPGGDYSPRRHGGTEGARSSSVSSVISVPPWWNPSSRARPTRSRNLEQNLGRIYLAVTGILAVLLLGPYLRLFGYFTKLPLPYFIVYTFVPGFRGFRDIGRYDQVVMAFLAATAALGAAPLFSRLDGRRCRALLVALATLMILEYWTVQQPLYPVASGAAIPPVYRWLSAAPPGEVAELPMCRMPGAYCVEEATYMYYSTYHWHPLINGGGGFFPAGWDAETLAIDQFPAPGAVATLLRYGARYLVVHPDYPRIAQVRALLGNGRASIAIGPYRLGVWRFGSDLLFVLPTGRGDG